MNSRISASVIKNSSMTSAKPIGVGVGIGVAIGFDIAAAFRFPISMATPIPTPTPIMPLKPPALPEDSYVCRACTTAWKWKSSPNLMEVKGSGAQGPERV